jgi:membrane fusion protein (multidrug efflux system)
MGSRAVGWIVADKCMGMRRLDGSRPRCGRFAPVGEVRPGRSACAALLAGALLLAACGGQHAGERPPPTVGVVTVQPQAVTLTTELPGRTSPYEIADVRPQVGGIIQARLFTEGGVVKAGQVLYQIEPAPFQAAYDQAKGQLANAEANLTDTRLKADRLAGLVKLNSAAKQDADDAEAAYKQALANVQQDKAAVEAARINLGWTKVTAPIGGKIGISTVTKGALVTASQTTALDTIQRLDPIYVDVTQSAAQVLALRRQLAAGGLRPGARAEVHLTLDDGSPYPLAGQLQFTDVTVDPTTDAVMLRAIFPNPSGLLLPGMFLRATVVEGVNPAALLVPQQGVTRDAKGGATALVVNAQNVIELRRLEVSQTVGDKWLVTSGLAAGDRVIVEGAQSAQPGMRVRVAPADNVQ